MAEHAEFLIGYAEEHNPVTVRGVYYQAEVHGLPGIDKRESSYTKVQRQVLALRREGRLPYPHIADLTRWMRKPDTYDNAEDALRTTARLYRKTLCRDANEYAEVWCQKDALAGVIYPIAALYDVPLMVARGSSSEMFCFEAVEARDKDPRPYWVYYLGDFDRSGHDAARALREKLERFAAEKGIAVVFEQLAITETQIHDLGLPTRSPKRESQADKNWPFDFACELDAIPPDYLRELAQVAIERHLPPKRFAVLKAAEDSERAPIGRLVGMIAP